MKNIKGLLVSYVGTTPLRVRKGSSLMVCVGLTMCAVLNSVGIPLRQGCDVLRLNRVVEGRKLPFL